MEASTHDKDDDDRHVQGEIRLLEVTLFSLEEDDEISSTAFDYLEPTLQSSHSAFGEKREVTLTQSSSTITMSMTEPETTMNEGEGGIDIQEMLGLQLAEVEMLQSMFANPGEFTLDDKSLVDELRAVVDGTINYDTLESRVGFTIKIVTFSSLPCQLELVCHFPHEYPSVHPEVFMRAPAMDRESHRHLSEELYKYLASLETGYILIGSVVEWLQQNAHLYLKRDEAEMEKSNSEHSSKKKMSFTRLWIYSHHIYSKLKWHDIIDWASELELKGFSMPGKPGAICVEGYTESVDEFWYRIRRLNWKRLMIKEQEVQELKGRAITALCRFSKFRELELEVVSGKGNTYHMDLGKFYEFLQEHDSAYIFPVYFGVEGKNVGD